MTDTNLSQTRWADFSAWRLENDRLRVVVIPELGAKIVSLFDKVAGYEWLVEPRRPLQTQDYGANFEAADLSGWDEMMPTIDACPYPAPGPFEGQALPDHGEVWALPWQVEATEGGALHLSVAGRVLPYRLERTLSLSENGLVMRYALHNLSDTPFIYLWAAHPLFAVTPATRLILPPHISEVCNVTDIPRWGDIGARYTWPLTEDDTGQAWDLSRLGPASRQDCRKFYVPPETRLDWVELREEERGHFLRLSWNETELPYLGLWMDEGQFSLKPVAAPEPSTGFFDSLSIAWENQRFTELEAGVSTRWALRVGVGSVD